MPITDWAGQPLTVMSHKKTPLNNCFLQTLLFLLDHPNSSWLHSSVYVPHNWLLRSKCVCTGTRYFGTNVNSDGEDGSASVGCMWLTALFLIRFRAIDSTEFMYPGLWNVIAQVQLISSSHSFSPHGPAGSLRRKRRCDRLTAIKT